MAQFKCIFCFDVFAQQSTATRHERKCCMSFIYGELLPVMTRMPIEFEALPILEKTKKCHEGNFYCQGVYPFIFIKEQKSPRTCEELKKYCAVNSPSLLHQLVRSMGTVTVKKSFLPTEEKLVCLKRCMRPKTRGRRRWETTETQNEITISSLNGNRTRQVSDTSDPSLVFFAACQSLLPGIC